MRCYIINASIAPYNPITMGIVGRGLDPSAQPCITFPYERR